MAADDVIDVTRKAAQSGRPFFSGDAEKSAVVPANAGTHTPRPLATRMLFDDFAHHQILWLWVPAFAGTTGRWIRGPNVPYLTGAEIWSVRSRSLMSTTVTIGAVSS